MAMLDLGEIKKQLEEGTFLDLDNGQLRAELDKLFGVLEESDQTISETLDGLLSEVDGLLDIVDDLEYDDETQ